MSAGVVAVVLAVIAAIASLAWAALRARGDVGDRDTTIAALDVKIARMQIAIDAKSAELVAARAEVERWKSAALAARAERDARHEDNATRNASGGGDAVDAALDRLSPNGNG